jgi:hypothetical protein
MAHSTETRFPHAKLMSHILQKGFEAGAWRETDCLQLGVPA